MEDRELKKLTDEHWKWVEGLMESLPDETMYGLSTVEYLYKTAIAHGYKHGLQEAERAYQKRKNDEDMIFALNPSN